jgi:hypothetical protein
MHSRLVCLRGAALALVLLASGGALSAGCDGGEKPDLLPIAPQQARVNETRAITLAVSNGSGRELRYRAAGPMLAGFESVTTISGSPDRGEFRWTPLASHVGRHEITFTISSPGGEVYDRERAVIEVLPSEDAAPAFVRPGAGGTHDIQRDPCVRFDIEIRDDDSTSVEIRHRNMLPEGASIAETGAKSAQFEWCPSRDQIAASERWTIELEADDGDHAPVPHDYVAVLRAGGTSGCTVGTAPEITTESPREGEVITSSSGYEVRISVTDDMGLRDAPLLYWSTETPADPERPDVTSYNQVVFGPGDVEGQWRARIPSLGLAEGAEAVVYYLASATDNDDAAGTSCDHRTDSPLISFFAVGGSSTGGDLAECDTCSRSSECESGICVPAAGGARCLTGCEGGAFCSAGTCGESTTIEGASAEACGDVAEVCDGSTSCTNDSLEPNDSTDTATYDTTSIYEGLQICSADLDYFRIDGSFGDLVTVTVDGFSHSSGDLDLWLVSSTGTILASSAGLTDTEVASFCLNDAGRVYARVFGYSSAQNRYDLTIERAPASCCSDDDLEPDDTVASARPLVGTDFEGTVCPGNDDFIAIPVASGGTLGVQIVFDSTVGDLDLELLDSRGTVLASSTGTTGIESIETTVAGGTYYARVFGFADGAAAYLGEVTSASSGTCASSLECALGDVCTDSGCEDDACLDDFQCPIGHFCPTYGPAAARHCGSTCSVNTDCRSAEACKWFPEGRACGIRGTAGNGAPCVSATMCGGQRACMAWSGGYCARAGCASNADCETGTYCTSLGFENVCVLECETDGSRCRTGEGYSCSSIVDTSGASHLACIPG